MTRIMPDLSMVDFDDTYLNDEAISTMSETPQITDDSISNTSDVLGVTTTINHAFSVGELGGLEDGVVPGMLR